MSGPLWNKKLTCPFCGCEFETPRARQRALRIKGKSSDFGSLYEGICPYLYAVTVCPRCLVAARNEEFEKFNAGYEPKLMEFSRRARAQPPKPEWGPPEGGVFTPDQAAKRHELAIVCHKLRARAEPGELAGLWMHVVWIRRLEGQAGAEAKAMEQALAAYRVFFEKGDRLPEKLGEPGVVYLMGELCRRLGRLREAREYFSKVLSMRDLEHFPNVESLAREQMLVAKEQVEAAARKG